MSVGYRAIQWSRPKVVYDLGAIGVVVVFLAAYVLASRLSLDAANTPSDEVLAISALGACAVTLLHVVLAIGQIG
ncbi:MAG: hypothetical protein K2X32_05735, partial [Phycisphaerales bacterium]|nr:hypothetical protein [Phycisphaerales bacterium]